MKFVRRDATVFLDDEWKTRHKIDGLTVFDAREAKNEALKVAK